MFVFEKRVGRYREKKTGKFISEVSVLKELDRNQHLAILDLQNTILPNFDQSKDNSDLLKQVAKKIKLQWLIEYAIGRGGIVAITDKEYENIDAEVQKQLLETTDPVTDDTYGLSYLLNQFEEGSITKGQFNARIVTYVKSSRTGFWMGKQQTQTELPYMQRILGDSEHCPDCLRYASVGVVPRDTLPLPGQQCVCHSNCQCSVQYLTTNQFTAHMKKRLSSMSVVTP